jgi:hypothetical protein
MVGLRRWTFLMALTFAVTQATACVTGGTESGTSGPHSTRPPDDRCTQVSGLVESVAWTASERLVVLATDDELVGSVWLVDTPSWSIDRVAEGGGLTSFVPLSGSDDRAIWVLPGGGGDAGIWASESSQSEPELILDTNLATIEDLSWTRRGFVVAANRANGRSLIAWLGAKGEPLEVMSDTGDVISAEVWASEDGSRVLIAETPLPESDPAVAQSVWVVSGNTVTDVELPDYATQLSMAPDGGSVLFRAAASGDLTQYSLADGSLVRVAHDIDTAVVSFGGQVAFARRVGPRAASEICVRRLA